MGKDTCNLLSLASLMPWLSRYSLPAPKSHHITAVSHLFRSASTKSASLAPILLRPYQESCLDACTDALKAGQTRIGVSLPTGSGKTTVFISLLSRIQPPENRLKATRSLIVVNSIELARQSAAQVKALFPDWSVEIEQGVKHNASGKADVYVCLAIHANPVHSNLSSKYCGDISDPFTSPAPCEISTEHTQSCYRG